MEEPHSRALAETDAEPVRPLSSMLRKVMGRMRARSLRWMLDGLVECMDNASLTSSQQSISQFLGYERKVADTQRARSQHLIQDFSHPQCQQRALFFSCRIVENARAYEYKHCLLPQLVHLATKQVFGEDHSCGPKLSTAFCRNMIDFGLEILAWLIVPVGSTWRRSGGSSMPSKSMDMADLEMGVVEGTRSSETENGRV